MQPTPPAASPSGRHTSPTGMPREGAVPCTQTMGMFSYLEKDVTIQGCFLILFFTACELFNTFLINSIDR